MNPLINKITNLLTTIVSFIRSLLPTSLSSGEKLAMVAITSALGCQSTFFWGIVSGVYSYSGLMLFAPYGIIIACCIAVYAVAIYYPERIYSTTPTVETATIGSSKI